MGRWQQRIQKSPRPELTELTKPDSVSFVSTHQAHIQKPETPKSPEPELTKPTEPSCVSSVSTGQSRFENNNTQAGALSSVCSQLGITPEEVTRALRLWESPFCRDDLKDLETGALPLWQARDYLALWIRENPEKVAHLKSGRETYPEQDQYTPLSKRLALPLLPEDNRFLHLRLAALPAEKHEWILEEYRRLWILASEAEPNTSKKHNTGRRATNRWLSAADLNRAGNTQSSTTLNPHHTRR
ncbi:hypothetical protein AU15_07820 [Marinobacter salarius]|uniref:Uncharacterized protein n=1 Tax=Marinobacter salarius TaxID=1420917 RepID=W5YVF8_9GAMM|nr:hypothetical protein AU15_07820 [Marinobacter salarius]